jgi:hypothetical protein
MSAPFLGLYRSTARLSIARVGVCMVLRIVARLARAFFKQPVLAII